jgi:hypothetical protein
LYCCTRQSNVGPVTFYLRFYQDGIVLSTASTGNAAEVAKWLVRSKQQHLHYSVDGASIHFEDRNGENTFVYNGTIYYGYITMRVDGYDTATKEYRGAVERTSWFTSVAMQQ